MPVNQAIAGGSAAMACMAVPAGAWGPGVAAALFIPLGKVVLDEVAFRAVLPALLSPWWTAVVCVLWELQAATGALAAPSSSMPRRNSGATVAAYVVFRRG